MVKLLFPILSDFVVHRSITQLMVRKIVYTFALVGGLYLLIWMAGCYTMSSQFATRKEAEEIIRKGLLPASLPESAYDIRESHDLDLNTGAGSFRFATKDAESFKNKLTPIAKMESITGSQQTMSRSMAVQFYQDGDFRLAIDWQQGEGKFWLSYTRKAD